MRYGVERRSKTLRVEFLKNWRRTIRYSISGAVVVALTSCEGKHRVYELPVQQDAAADPRELLPPSSSASSEGARDASSSETPNIATALVPEGSGNPPLESASSNGAAASGDVGEAVDAAPGPLDANCSGTADCASGFCAPGVDGAGRCCDRACNTSPCERCSAEGSCGALPTFAQECQEVTCPLDNVCQDFEQSIAAGTCQDAARCAAASDCTFDWKPAAREGQACACNGNGCTLLVREGDLYRLSDRRRPARRLRRRMLDRPRPDMACRAAHQFG